MQSTQPRASARAAAALGITDPHLALRQAPQLLGRRAGSTASRAAGSRRGSAQERSRVCARSRGWHAGSPCASRCAPSWRAPAAPVVCAGSEPLACVSVPPSLRRASRRTSSGLRDSQHAAAASHRSLPWGTAARGLAPLRGAALADLSPAAGDGGGGTREVNPFAQRITATTRPHSVLAVQPAARCQPPACHELG